QLLDQPGQVALHGLPHYALVYLEVAMRDPVAHALHARPWNLRMGREPGRVALDQLGRDLADGQHVHGHRVLGLGPAEEFLARHPFHIAAGLSRRPAHVAQPAGEAVAGHSGRASRSTWSRKRTGRSPGVRTSTGTPSSSSRAICRPPRSNRVVSGVGSTSRSRSLPSRSVPCTTDPYTRGLATRNWRVVPRRAGSCSWRAWEGFMTLAS